MTLKSEMLAIKKSSKDNMLHAERVVAWAGAHKTSELYGQFLWDDTKCGREYRLWQARRLILLVVVNDKSEPEMVSLTIDRQAGGGYRGIDDVLTSSELSEIMLQDALAELNRIRAKYQRIKALVEVWEAVEKVKTKRAVVAPGVSRTGQARQARQRGKSRGPEGRVSAG